MVLIDPEGKVICTHLLNGHPILNDAVVDAAKKWTFKPLEDNGKSVAV